MADNKQQNGTGEEEGGLGNLPPLSDFESNGGLPPLGSISNEKESLGGLPPISDINIETPQPSGGAIKPPPPSFDMDQEFDTPAFNEASSSGKISGFKSAFGEDTFAPETPEIGLGQEPTMDTPMFDSAFGGGAGGGGGFTPVFQTPAPTQAMQTPAFGGQQPSDTPSFSTPPGFDENAFAPAGGDFDFGTPAPDFTPDTGAAAAGAAASATAGTVATGSGKQKPPKPVKQGGGIGMGALVASIVVCLALGLVLGVFFCDKMTFMSFAPIFGQLAEKQATIDRQKIDLDKLASTTSPGGEKLTPEKLSQMIAEAETLTNDIKKKGGELETLKGNLTKEQSTLDQVKADLDAKNEEFVKAQESFEELQNQTSILQARQMGLVAESERLTGLVGSLDEALERTRDTKAGLLHSVEQLAIQVKEGIPLTPEKYAREARINAVSDLKRRVSEAQWVTTTLMDDYTALYRKELAISECTEYFFAKVPVTDRFGTKEMKWAECLMKGNWAVYYRSLDGKSIGSYENLSPSGAVPQYGFRELLPELVQKQIEGEIFASRTPGFEEKLKSLAEKQLVTEGKANEFQRVYNSF